MYIDKNISIIAFTGLIGCGKSTSANLFESVVKDFNAYNYNVEVIRFSFANSLKVICGNLFENIVDKNCFFNDKDTIYPELSNNTPRSVLIDFGLFIRKYDSSYFAKYLYTFIKTLDMHKKHIIIIDDLRFENEVNIIKAITFKNKIVRIINDENQCESYKVDHEGMTYYNDIMLLNNYKNDKYNIADFKDKLFDIYKSIEQ